MATQIIEIFLAETNPLSDNVREQHNLRTLCLCLKTIQLNFVLFGVMWIQCVYHVAQSVSNIKSNILNLNNIYCEICYLLKHKWHIYGLSLPAVTFLLNIITLNFKSQKKYYCGILNVPLHNYIECWMLNGQTKYRMGFSI